MDPYYKGVEATMALYSGGYRSLPRHHVTTLEGDWHPDKGVVILEFPSHERALAWYHSPEYAPLLELRNKTGRMNMILVDGLGEDEAVGTGQPDPWEIERIAELEALEARAQRGDSTETT
jgi:uncharacterized protein (DUF1330 family)